MRSVSNFGSLQRPFVLLHFAPIFVAIAAASAILVAAAAAAPLFTSSTATSSLRIAIEGTADRALVVNRYGPIAADIANLRDRVVRAETHDFPDLDAPTETLSGSELSVLGSGGAAVTALAATRTGFATHMDVVSGDASARGLWLRPQTADELGVVPGDTVTATLEDRTARAVVAGTFEASRSDPFWTELLAATGGEREPSTLVVLDRDAFLTFADTLQDDGLQSWTFALAEGADRSFTLERAGVLADDIAAFNRDAGDPKTRLGTILANPALSDQVTGAVREAQDAERTITPAIQTLALTGVLVALFGMTAAGVYGVRRRRIEMRSLDAKGVTWRDLWLRSAVEALLPVVAGGVLGWLVTWWTIRSFGPSDVIEPSAVGASIRAALIPAVLAMMVVAAVTAVAARRQAHEAASGAASERSSGGLWWEIPVLVLAGAALYEIWTRGTSAVSFEGREVEVDRLLLLFPFLFLAATAGLAVRGLGRLLLAFRGATDWPVAMYLASRRVSTAPRVALLLVTASTLAIGVLAYAGTAVATIRESTRNKILISTGADVVGTTTGPIFPPEAGSGMASTNVMRLSFVRTGSDGTENVSVIGIEPDSFEQAAYWSGDLSEQPLPDMLRALDVTTEPLPAVVVGGELPPGQNRLQLAGYELPLDVVGTASAFPGQGADLAVVVSAESLRTVLEEHDALVALNGARYQAWVDGRPSLARSFLITSGADPPSIVVTEDRLETPGLRALAWSFVFMELIGVVTALIALIGLVLYLQARQRSREVSYALGRRMGLTRGAHRLAVALEIALLLASAYVIGSMLAIATALLIYTRLDPLPDLPPDARLHVPGTLLAAIGASIVACAWLGAWIVQRRAERAQVGAVLRFAE